MIPPVERDSGRGEGSNNDRGKQSVSLEREIMRKLRLDLPMAVRALRKRELLG